LLSGFEGGLGWAVPRSWAVGLSKDWASFGPGEDLSVVEELEELHGIWVQSDDRVIIIGGFFLSKITVE